jgi:membrane protein implicated in regulation of membrane protease activity
MKRMRVSIGMLIAIEVALIAHAVADGLNFANALAGALTALLLVASVWLWRTGRRLSRDSNLPSTGSTRAARADRGNNQTV